MKARPFLTLSNLFLPNVRHALHWIVQYSNEDLWNKSNSLHPTLHKKDNAKKGKENKPVITQPPASAPCLVHTSQSGCSAVEDSSNLPSTEALQHDNVINPSEIHDKQNLRKVALFQLDHKGGRKDGLDITFSTLIFLIQTATVKIDLFFAYIQLFPELEKALQDAVARVVIVRLITNSDETTNVAYFNGTLRNTLERLLTIGVKVFIPEPKAEYRHLAKESKTLPLDCCLHN